MDHRRTDSLIPRIYRDSLHPLTRELTLSYPLTVAVRRGRGVAPSLLATDARCTHVLTGSGDPVSVSTLNHEIGSLTTGNRSERIRNSPFSRGRSVSSDGSVRAGFCVRSTLDARFPAPAREYLPCLRRREPVSLSSTTTDGRTPGLDLSRSPNDRTGPRGPTRDELEGVPDQKVVSRPRIGITETATENGPNDTRRTDARTETPHYRIDDSAGR